MSRRRLRWLLFGCWLLLVLPLLALIWQTERQIKWEAFHQYRAVAEDLVSRIDTQLQADALVEDARSASDYQFLVVGGDPALSRLLQRSPLAAFPPQGANAGVLGYFQVDANGVFSTPLLPLSAEDGAAYGLNPAELQQRGERSRQLLSVLESNELVAKRTAFDARSPSRESGLGSAASSAEREAGPSELVSGRDMSVADRDLNAVAEDMTAREPARQAPMPQALSPAPPPPAAPSVAAEQKQKGTTEESAIPQQAVAGEGADYLANQRGFDELQSAGGKLERSQKSDYGRLDQLKLRQNYLEQSEDHDGLVEQRAKKIADALDVAKGERSPRKEQVVALDGAGALDDALSELASGRVRMFEGELDPFEFSLLGDAHGMLYRRVWRDGQRWIQGLLFERAAWMRARIEQPFRASPLAGMSDLLVVYRGEVLRALPGERERSYVSAEQLQGEVLLQARLSAPYADLQLVWTINDLPAGPGAQAVRGLGVVLLTVLSVVFWVLYRLGGRQIDLTRQQQDFVSAVSHELKTPLTSIRMYGELLLQGWASEAKKQEYYGFIHEESERLSRLIGNVLQLARMERNELQLKLESRSLGTLVDLARSKLAAQVERSGFVLNIELDPAMAERLVEVDTDAWLQILINLVDNALKFSLHASTQQVDLQVLVQGERVLMRVRDYGPGIPKDQLQKIFRLFYRVGSELTREAVGTGIGLALARQLAVAMRGELDVRNREPGAEFELRLPLLT
ncbi:sensor histidine kinase [Pseudomarimonas arenosa]|uniref:histidine kinase n=1 Tax=Pseudomarimonas arenosa TaxID=2774145 RepID=A0AAW3ZTY1_9GAMM|nr:HAMP domain-containing sensor histidine kinase [Pseudomarimonas arenosa]MBD8527812.1 HAMP domain-containing histidine kinase [Pseudomarimonas arenosa]